MRLALIGFLLTAAMLPAQDLPDWVIALSRIKHHNRAELQRIPNFVCLESVERFEARRGKGFEQRDTLHLQVAVIDNKELTAQADSARLDDVVDMKRFSQGGSLGTGVFSSFASNLFVHDNGRTTGWGREDDGSSSIWRFDYEIPELLSGYQIATLDASATVAERGSFWADAKTFDLLRLEAEAVDIPLRLELQDVITHIEYQRVRIGESDVLMPSSAEQVLISTNGERKRNVIAFSGCREYRSDSVIKFDSGK